MKIGGFKIKLKNVQVELFDDSDDIMYLYYTLVVSSKDKEEVEFVAYDFPKLEQLENVVYHLDKDEWIYEEDKYRKSQQYLKVNHKFGMLTSTISFAAILFIQTAIMQGAWVAEIPFISTLMDLRFLQVKFL